MEKRLAGLAVTAGAEVRSLPDVESPVMGVMATVERVRAIVQVGHTEGVTSQVLYKMATSPSHVFLVNAMKNPDNVIQKCFLELCFYLVANYAVKRF